MGSDYTGEATSAVGEFKDSAVRKTNAAVAEGKYDVAAAKAAGAAYVEKAKELATSALETAQVRLMFTLLRRFDPLTNFRYSHIFLRA
jgi:hypothetical protein